MTLNRELFLEDPTSKDIPNLGVSKLGRPTDEREWEVLRYELSSFVCDGEYERGLDRILSTYLTHLDQSQQPAVWISGFYGSGKSHLVRVLEHLWRDVKLPDSSSARGLVNLPEQVERSLKELSTAAKRTGGLWSAAGTLGSGAGDSVRLAFLSVVLRAAGLPERLAPAQCAIWLKKEGLHDQVRDALARGGHSLDYELRNLYVSPPLASAILEAKPDLAPTASDVSGALQAQFQDRSDISSTEMLDTLHDVLELQSDHPGRIPCTLVVLDEMQQFIAEDTERALAVQDLVEACSSRFKSQILIVATGQSSLQSTSTLQKLTDRFSVQIQLSDADVESVIRQVILRKRADKVGELNDVLDRSSGEIDQQLSGARIAPIPDDAQWLVADYPLLPARRRFWEQLLRDIDKGGKAGQLRTQLKVVHEASRRVAENALGTVVPADFIYEQQTTGMLTSGVLLRGVHELIEEERRGGTEGLLRARILALTFLISQLSREGFADTGVRPTAAHMADLLVDDLTSSNQQLRRQVPHLLEQMVAEAKLQRVEDEYQLQTPTGQEWTKDYHERLRGFLGDHGRVDAARDKFLRSVVIRQIPTNKLHGDSRTPRRVTLQFGDIPPEVGNDLPIWLRSGWDLTEKQLLDVAAGAGQESPLVFVYLPKHEPDALKQALGELDASQETLNTRAHPNTVEGQAARRSMQSTRDRAEKRVDALVREVLRRALVVQAGGNRIVGPDLRSAVESSLGRALDRMYPRFREADHGWWGTVVTRAQQGNADPLGAVGYSGDVAHHPICKAVREATSGSGTSGTELRKRFESTPFGWPRDAVHGALLALLPSGAVTAEDNGVNVSIRDVVPSKIGKMIFRREEAVVTTIQRIAVRQVLSKAGLTAESNEEAVACASLVQKLIDLAESAGGPAPLPPSPSTPQLIELRGKKGTALVVAVAERQLELIKQMIEWTGLRDLKAPRLEAYRDAKRLVEQARDLADASSLNAQLESISTARSVLSQPDPVKPIIDAATDVLRKEVRRHVAVYRTELKEALDSLSSDGTWTGLLEGQRRSLAAQHGLVSIDDPDLSSSSAVLSAVERRSLSSWDDSIRSLQVRIQDAREAAAKLLEPKAVRVNPPHTTLRSEDAVERYTTDLRTALLETLHEHGSVII